MKKLLFSLLVTGLITTVSEQKTINDANAEKRNVSGFHAIEVGGGIDLYLSQGEEAVAVSASKNEYRARIKTEVKNGVLKIWYEWNSNLRFDWSNHKLKAYVSFKDIDRLEGSGGSDISVDGSIKVAKLAMEVSGGSDFDGKVETGELNIQASGGSDVRISGKADRLTIDASGGSDVYYKGTGLIRDLKTSGSSIKKVSK